MAAEKGNQYKTGHNKYTPDLIAKARAYLKNFKTEFEDAIPSMVGLSRAIGTPRNTFYLWIKKSKDEEREGDPLLDEIVGVFEQIHDEQERTLLNGGLGGSFNPAITKLVLGKHGYHDKQDSNIQGGFSVTIGDKDAGTL